MFYTNWLPCIRVVDLSEQLRQLDKKALDVKRLDPDDYPTAALAAILSPSILLTHNFKDFSPLGTREWRRGINGIAAVSDIVLGQRNLLAIASIPSGLVVVIISTLKSIAAHSNPTLLIFAVVLLLVIVAVYRRQTPDRNESIHLLSNDILCFLLEQSSEAIKEISYGNKPLDSYMVGKSAYVTTEAAVLRLLALTSEPLSAQQIGELLDKSVRPRLQSLRAFLHANKNRVFEETRRGRFMLGCPINV